MIFGGGCTAELISDQGLILTNHHCGFSRIQFHSSLEHDYLTDGFWAMSKKEELVNEGLTVTFLVRMEDVTKKILIGINKDMSDEEKDKIIEENMKMIEAAARNENNNKVGVKILISLRYAAMERPMGSHSKVLKSFTTKPKAPTAGSTRLSR